MVLVYVREHQAGDVGEISPVERPQRYFSSDRARRNGEIHFASARARDLTIDTGGNFGFAYGERLGGFSGQ